MPATEGIRMAPPTESTTAGLYASTQVRVIQVGKGRYVNVNMMFSFALVTVLCLAIIASYKEPHLEPHQNVVLCIYWGMSSAIHS